MTLSKKLIAERTPTLTTAYKYYVVFDQECLELSEYFVDELKTFEGQWYSRIIPDYSERQNGKIFYRISDIFIPKQTVTTITVDSEPADLAEMWQQLKKDRNLTATELKTLMSEAGAWCHSHVNMEAKPTGTDQENWTALIKDATTPKAMLIFNQKRDIYCRVFDPSLDGIIIEQPPIAVENSYNYKKIDSAISSLVSKKSSVVTVTSGGSPPAPLAQSVYAGTTTSKDTTTTTDQTDFVFHYMGKH
jgi:hypothetical protein